MRNEDWDAMHDDAEPSAAKPSAEKPSASRGNIWLQRFAGILLGGLAGTGAAYSADLWHVMWNGGLEAPGQRAAADRPQAGDDRTSSIPAPEPAENARQIAHTLVTRARELISRGEIREAERFLAAAEKLEPDSPTLAETRRLLDIAKAKIELATSAPAAGGPERTQAEPPTPAATPSTETPAGPSPSEEFAIGVKEFRAKNYNAALAAFGKAAAAGHAPAQNYLGYMHRHGFGVDQDFAKALAWYQNAAAQNHAGATNNIGYMYRHGLGVERNYAEARSWFKRAAERGDPAGQYNLGQMLADGVGAAADYREAYKWYKTAADQGHARAAMGLAHLYAQGLGVTADLVEAYFWYGVAANSGVEGAQRFRTALGAQISSTQRQSADGRLAALKPQRAEGEAR
jgi:tetratricopeptide (TPR) repeat protein